MFIIWILLKDHLIIIWWLSDDQLKIIWWSYKDQLMSIWRSPVHHLKIIICLFEDIPVLNISWSYVDYDDYLITIWSSPEDHLKIFWWTSKHHLNIIRISSWISSIDHLKTIIHWLSDYHWKIIRWSYDDYLIIICRTSDYCRMIIRRWSSKDDYLLIK